MFVERREMDGYSLLDCGSAVTWMRGEVSSKSPNEVDEEEGD